MGIMIRYFNNNNLFKDVYLILELVLSEYYLISSVSKKICSILFLVRYIKINWIYFPKRECGSVPIIKILVVRAMTVSGKFFFTLDCTW